MMTPPVACASSSASADLPLAVGPAISTASLHAFVATPHLMTLVATLISIPALDRCRHSILRARCCRRAAAADWLAPGIAADIAFDGRRSTDGRSPSDCARRSPAGPIDVVVQPAADRRKKLFLADMDSTMIGQECIDELADFAGLKAHVAAITERAMRGEIAFEPALRERVALLKGLPVAVVDEVMRERITLTPGGRDAGRAPCARMAPIPASSPAASRCSPTAIAAKIGFRREPRQHAARRRRQAGRDRSPSRSSAAKPSWRRSVELRAKLELDAPRRSRSATAPTISPCCATPGSASPIHAKPAVAAAAAARIDHGDLTALLYLQGYRRDEFVT